MKCEAYVKQYVPRGWSHVVINSKCGTTAYDGSLLLCPVCRDRAARRHPQGWRYAPGDTCRHGTYLGTHEHHDEVTCGECEAQAVGERND